MGKVLLEMKGICKSFPGVKALDNVEFRIYEGEVMGFLGENGAGKSTLMKVLSGVYEKEAGQIIFNGEDYNPSNPKDAMDKGVAIIHQEFNLAENMKVYENIYLGREITRSGRLDKKAMYDRSKEILKSLDTNIDPEDMVADLSLAQKQMVEIATALALNAKIIIMDEPTDALTSKEVNKLFKVIRQLREDGKGVVYISHRLDEIGEICDRYIVLRDGKFIGEKLVEESNEDEAIHMMVGRKLDEYIPYVQPDQGDISFEVKNLANKYIKDVSFHVSHGEILGIAGLVGAGRSELAKTLYGHYEKDRGELYLDGELIDIKNEKDAIDKGIVYVSEDRKEEGLVLDMSVSNNMTLSSLAKFTGLLGRIDKAEEGSHVDNYIRSMNIKTPNPSQIVANLSGGNQQKVSIAKGLMTDPKILILDEPTRGVDVAAKNEIYNILNDIKSQGKAILVISSDLLEILGLSDRIIVINEGVLKGELFREEATQEKIMELIVKGGSHGGKN